MLDRYPGAKSNSGIQQWIINQIPYHEVYCELFAGSAQIFRTKRRAQHNWLGDINPGVIGALEIEFNRGHNGSTGKYSIDYWRGYALEFFKDRYASQNPNTFIYLDPPYPTTARRSQRALYKNEMLNEDEHSELLQALLPMRCLIMISTRQNELYDQVLKDWRKAAFNTVDRGGATQEIIYMNYPEPTLLHQYDYLGDGFTRRQNIKRKVQRFHGKIQELPAYERHLFIQELIKHDAAAVKHFMTMLEQQKRNF